MTVTSVTETTHAPDQSLVAVENGSVVARCSCWWRGTPKNVGFIGRYDAAYARAGAAILDKACDILATAGCTSAVGPVDGNTWRRYRFVVDRGAEPTFFLEPDNPNDWPEHWSGAGFSPAATYISALNDDLTIEDPRTAASLARLAGAGISIRCFDLTRPDSELRRIFALTIVAFSQNFLYSPIAEAEFLAQNRALLPFLRPDLVLLAERGDTLVGYIFALPDVPHSAVRIARRGPRAADTVILKTIAVDPSVGGMGLGGVLMDLVQRSARRSGFRRAIHALMHETNASRTISSRYARTIRRYAVFSRGIGAGQPCRTRRRPAS